MRILHIEDEPFDAELIQKLITEEWSDAQIVWVSSRDALIRELEGQPFDAILSDFALPSFDGMEALRIAKERSPDTPFVFVSGTIGEERAIEAVRLGAEDYVLKDHSRRLLMVLPRAVNAAAERRQRREAELRIRELGNALNQAREAVVVTDLDGRITFWNHGAELLSGRSAADVLDRTAGDVFGAATAAGLAAAFKSVNDTGEWSGELELPRTGNASRIVELRMTLIRDEHGWPKSRLILATDITDRRAAERRVREQADMLNQAREAIYIADLHGKVIYWNEGAERTFRWSAQEAVGAELHVLLRSAGVTDVEATRLRTLDEGQWGGELQVYTRDGEPITVDARQTVVLDETGGRKATLCISSDITERKQLQDQFLRAQRMENLGLLAAGIAHDLNNMLAPILLATPMLRENVADPSALKLLDTLEKSADRGAQLVRQILSFAHGMGGEHHVVQVKHLLRDVASVISGTFPKSIHLQDYIPSDLWPIVGNPTQIHQVLLNLCVNARDAMPNGGNLALQAQNEVIDAAAAAGIPGGRAGPFLVIEVSDTGTGIPAEILKRIWEPFFTTKGADRGTGLGLSTVRGIVQAHHGFADVKSTVGRGTTFRVYLPASAGNLPESTQETLRLMPQGKGELILVVDDEQQIRDTVSQMLTRHGYRVLLACDGTEATAVFAQRAVDIRLVICDLHMPKLDGATFGRALRQINTGAKMLVVSGMASRLGDQGDIHPEEFADALLMKPFKAETLLELVHELLHVITPMPFTVR